MDHNKITVGSRVYGDADAVEGSCFIGNSIPGDELSVDTLTVTVSEGAADLSALPYGTPVEYKHDNVLVGKFFLKTVQRRSAGLYELSCVSAVGLLDRLDHYGGLYGGTPARDVLADIIGGAVEYTVDTALGAVPVYGWLPVASRRDNLRQLLFALGGALQKDTAGVIQIKFLTSDSPKEISDDRLGADGSIDYKTPVTGVAVTEHGYGTFSTDETATLFDGQIPSEAIITPKGATVNGLLVTFADPVHDLSVNTGSILESGVNYAVIGGASRATLTGKKYTHMTRVISRTVDGLPAGTKENIAKVEDATLVSAANSGNVADRVLAYYSAARVIRTDMVFGPERPGDAVALNDPFDQRVEGLLQSQDINIGNTLMADAEIACGYVPSGGGNNFEHSVVLTGSGTWAVPAGVKKIRAIVIGGGGAGRDGESGTVGDSVRDGSAQKTNSGTVAQGVKVTVSASANVESRPRGTGGVGGEAGSPGKVYEVDLNVTPGQSFAYRSGAGGQSSGAAGAESVFGTASSQSGDIYNNGYLDVLGGVVYALKGPDGVQGGDGGGPGEDGGSVGGSTGGKMFEDGRYQGSQSGEVSTSVDISSTVSGSLNPAGGGGAGGSTGTAAGENGKDAYFPSTGRTRIRFQSTIAAATVYTTVGGGGGNGAHGADGAAYGSSGAGGGGGGGVGANGSSSLTNEASTRHWYGSGQTRTLTVTAQAQATSSSPESPGTGGKGGKGAAGCIIIYY